MSRRVVWLQLLIGWLPLWGLFTTLIVAAHGISALDAAWIALRMIVGAALLGVFVQRLTERYPWPSPVHVRFVIAHLGFAFAYATSWVVLNSVIESIIRRAFVINVGAGIASFLLLGVWLYVMIAGVSYTTIATERAARAEAIAAKSQLAALRSQLHPHFLFNALHSVVHLIPREPQRAAAAAEHLAGLLRRTIEEDRDLVPVSEELAFVERYLELERMRFGDRLRVTMDVSDDAREALVPLFALQTLVENAVRHGAAPRVEPTDIMISGRVVDVSLEFTVIDSGDGADLSRLEATGGTGLKRLRERLSALYRGTTSLRLLSRDPSGFSATITFPREEATS